MKPHITKAANGGWYCWHNGIAHWGPTIEQAWECWLFLNRRL